jgi:hypothetical protein
MAAYGKAIAADDGFPLAAVFSRTAASVRARTVSSSSQVPYLSCQQSMEHDKDQERGGGHNFAENGQVHNS